jgi:hypothetical protein
VTLDFSTFSVSPQFGQRHSGRRLTGRLDPRLNPRARFGQQRLGFLLGIGYRLRRGGGDANRAGTR